jgi:PAS domain-containing protein
MTLETWSDLRPAIPLLTATIAAAALLAGWTWRRRRPEPRSVTRSTLFDALEDAVLALDGHDRAIDLNPAMATLLGIEPSEAIGRTVASLFGRAGLPSALLDDPAVTAIALRDRHYAMRIVPLVAEGCGDRARLVVLQDITRRIEAARARHALIEELQETLKERPHGPSEPRGLAG